MKRCGLLAGVMAVLVMTAVNVAAASSDDQKTVAALDTRYQAAVKANDAATMDRILADDFVLVLGDGTVNTKADLLNEARSKRVLYEHQEELEQTVRVWGDTAVVTAKLYVTMPGTMKVTRADGKTEIWNAKAGEQAWMDADPPHMSENIGKTTIQYVLVEVKSAAK